MQSRTVGAGVRVSLVLLAFVVALRRYGIYALVTGHTMKHAAIGRGKRFYLGQHTRAIVGDNNPAYLLVRQLRWERQMAFAKTIVA